MNWGKKRKKISTSQEMIEACHTIRNNLFHGGKHNDPCIERNLTLLRAAKKILLAAKDSFPDIKKFFDEAYLYIQ